MNSRPPAVDDRPAVVVAAGVLQPFRRQLGILAERNLPADRAGVEIDRVERAPRRRDRRVAVGVAEDAFRRRCGISASSDRCVSCRIRALVAPGDQELDEVGDVARAHVRERRHPSGALADDASAISLARAAIADAFERRRRRRAFAVLAVAASRSSPL